METHRRNQTITRYRHPGVVPLELWDLWIGGRILWDVMGDTEFPEVLGRTLRELQRGIGATRSEGCVPAVIADFDAIFVTGGRSQESSLRSALSTLTLPVCLSSTPQNPGRVAGLELLTQRGSVKPWICDLGQASFKLCSSSASRQFARDLEKLPIRRDTPDEVVAEQRGTLRQWLATSLRAFGEITAPPDALFFALPSRLDDSGNPEGSSYIGMAGDTTLVAEAIEMSGLAPRFGLVVNDAELAALDASAEPTLFGSSKILVITLGFGLGAALVLRKGDSSHA